LSFGIKNMCYLYHFKAGYLQISFKEELKCIAYISVNRNLYQSRISVGRAASDKSFALDFVFYFIFGFVVNSSHSRSLSIFPVVCFKIDKLTCWLWHAPLLFLASRRETLSSPCHLCRIPHRRCSK